MASDAPFSLFDRLGSSSSVTRLVLVAAAAIGLILFVAFVMARLLRARTRGLSIRMQVFLALAATVGAFAFGLGLMVIDRIEARAVRLATQAARDEAAVISGIIESEMTRSGVTLELIAARFEERRKHGVQPTLELLAPNGRRLFPPEGTEPDREDGMVVFGAPLVVSGEHRGTIRVIKPTVVMSNLLADFAPTVLVISLVLGAAAALAAAWIGRAIAAPIEAISVFGERVSEGERMAPPAGSGGREVARLSRAIESMRRQLEGRPFVETFAADLSHELKNPVAAIRASAELLDEGAIEDPEAARRFVKRIREASDRIERLLKELLGLASIEARGLERAASVDVGKVTEEVVRSLEEHPRVELSVGGDVRVRGDEKWIARAAQNLVANALVHSAPGTLVGVRVYRRGPSVELSVQNEGEVSAHVKGRAFRRFVTTRPDKGGTGLGLSIVRAVAEAHGGHAELFRPGPPAVEFRLVLPAFRRLPEPVEAAESGVV